MSRGDMILADDEGVVVIHPQRIDALLEQATAIKDAEQNLVRLLETGYILSNGFNLDEHVDALTTGKPSSLKFLD